MDGLGAQQEKDVLEVVVESDRAEEVFDYIFHRGKLDTPHHGVIFMAALSTLTVMQLPEMEDLADRPE
jgi:nitrogen regulatory protein PII